MSTKNAFASPTTLNASARDGMRVGRPFDDLLTSSPLTWKRRSLRASLTLLEYAGVGAVYVWARQIQGAVILAYHSVAREHEAQWIDPRNHLRPELFEKHVRFLARHRRVVSMTRLAEAIDERATLPAGTVVLTFDDGYLDNLTVVAPLLEQYALPATLYLATRYVERGEPQWVDRLYSTFRGRTRDQLAVLGPAARTYDLSNARQKLQGYRTLCQALLSAGALERDELLRDVEAQLAPATTPPPLTMTWTDLLELRRRHPAFEIGGHTRDHLDLSAHDVNATRAQIAQCSADLARALGEQPVHFSFPYSRSAPHARELLQAAGFRTAVTSGRDCLIAGSADPFALPRISSPASLALLRFMTGGAYPALPLGFLGRA